MDLTMATIDQLFDEISSRYVGVLLVLERETPGDSECNTFSVKHHGGLTLGVGLAHRAADVLLNSDETEWSDDDDGN